MMNDFNVCMRYEEWVCADLNEIVEQGDEANFLGNWEGCSSEWRSMYLDAGVKCLEAQRMGMETNEILESNCLCCKEQRGFGVYINKME
ncbi:hypothetical protein C5167_036099 [Papaver somniferum]|nr:hypothetical protein C5167_036099 [Papaver somniferum]